MEAALYETDKHVVDRMDDLCVAFMENGVHMEDIENVYVLGHSFAPADLEYFEFLHAVTRCNCNYEAISPVGHMDMELFGAMLNGNDEVLMAGIRDRHLGWNNKIWINFPSSWLQLDVSRENITGFSDVVRQSGNENL